MTHEELREAYERTLRINSELNLEALRRDFKMRDLQRRLDGLAAALTALAIEHGKMADDGDTYTAELSIGAMIIGLEIEGSVVVEKDAAGGMVVTVGRGAYPDPAPSSDPRPLPAPLPAP